MSERFWKVLAVSALGLLALREIGEMVSPARGLAQSNSDSRLYVEPGTADIPLPEGGNAIGKIFIDLDTGDTYGFPVFGPKMPYPGKQVSENRPLTRRPVYLGKFYLDGFGAAKSQVKH